METTARAAKSPSLVNPPVNPANLFRYMSNSLPDSTAFHLGKEARKNGKPCQLIDGRLSPKTREDWYSGWNHQDALMQPTPTSEAIQESQSFLKSLAQEVRDFSKTIQAPASILPTFSRISDYAQRVDGLYCGLDHRGKLCGGVFLVYDRKAAEIQVPGQPRFYVCCHKCNRQGFESSDLDEMRIAFTCFLTVAPASELHPLFINLNYEYYDAFTAGSKQTECRLYGPIWNEKTCIIGRRVTLTRAYRQPRLSRIITAYQTLTEPPDPVAWSKCYGDKKGPIAAITLSPL